MKSISVTVLLALNLLATVAAQPTLDPLIAPEHDVSESTALAVSDSGDTVVGYASTGGRTRAWRWDAGTVHWLADAEVNSSAVDVSGDGLVIVGTWIGGNGVERAAVWRNGEISLPVSGPGRALMVSPNGEWVVGQRHRSGWLLDKSQHLWQLPATPVGLTNNTVLLANGQRWQPDAKTPAPPSEPADPGVQFRFQAIADDGGATLRHFDGPRGHQAQIEFGETGVTPVTLGTLAADQEVFAQALDLSADGQRVVGVSERSDHKPTAFLWTSALGMRGIQETLLNEGLALPGWWLETATAISRNGQVVVGWGINPNGKRSAWRIRLPSLDAIDRDHYGALRGLSRVAVEQPVGVAHLPNQNVIVLDAASGRVRQFTSAALPLNDLAQSSDWVGALSLAKTPTGLGILTPSAIDLMNIDGARHQRLSLSPDLQPAGLAYSKNSWLVSDQRHQQIIRLRQDGTAETFIDQDLDQPGALLALPAGELLVIDQGGRRLQRFSARGLLLATQARRGSGPGQIRRLAALTHDGAYVVGADADNHRIQSWNATGTLAASWGYPQFLPDQPVGRLLHPSGISLSPTTAVVCSMRAADCRWFIRTAATHPVPRGLPIARWKNPGVANFGAPLALLPGRLLVAIHGGSGLAVYDLQSTGHAAPNVLGWPGRSISQFNTITDLAVSDQQLVVLDGGAQSLTLVSVEKTLRLIRRLDLVAAKLPITRIAANAEAMLGLDLNNSNVWHLSRDFTQRRLIQGLNQPGAIAADRAGFWILDGNTVIRLSSTGQRLKSLDVAATVVDKLAVASEVSLAASGNGQLLMSRPDAAYLVDLVSGQTLDHLQTLDRPTRLIATDQFWAVSEWGRYRYHVFDNEEKPIFSAGSALHGRP